MCLSTRRTKKPLAIASSDSCFSPLHFSAGIWRANALLNVVSKRLFFSTLPSSADGVLHHVSISSTTWVIAGGSHESSCIRLAACPRSTQPDDDRTFSRSRRICAFNFVIPTVDFARTASRASHNQRQALHDLHNMCGPSHTPHGGHSFRRQTRHHRERSHNS